MSQQPVEPTPTPPPATPPAPSRSSSLLRRSVIGLAVIGLGGFLFWKLVGADLYEQVKEYQLAVEDRDLSAPVGYLGLNYRKEYNSRPPQFHFEEDGKKLLFASIGDGETPEFYDVTDAQFDPMILQGGFGRDSIPGVDYPILQAPDGEIAQNIGDRNEVVGVVLESGPRAYPMGALTKVEIVNDVDGETPIAIVYARGPDTVRIYRRDIEGTPVTLGTTGYATDDKVPLFYDRKTKSLWLEEPDGSALTCVNGEYVGTRLPAHKTLERLTWGEWVGQYPDTDVLIGNDRSQPIPEE
ncbi:DUF3179 domain-containing (seleno)protein [Tautonia marina]|uniref:DUF3179 domain-containing (seleno)protein n=1 Tax=Tautonia marina TaxID=2653855 RepID=UPI0012610382|nr:DUF3179 domain-containing (seleno)protein [Tautonia marina]